MLSVGVRRKKQRRGKFFESGIVCMYFVQRESLKERHLEVLVLRVENSGTSWESLD